MREIAKIITSKYRYLLEAKDFARIGVMCKRYNKETVLACAEDIDIKDRNLDHVLNVIEKRCQKVLNSGMDIDLAKELLS